MVRIKLSKGLSYSGIVTATKKSPYVTTDEDTAKEAVASGYFEYVPEAVSESSAEKSLKFKTSSKVFPLLSIKLKSSKSFSSNKVLA